MGLMDSLLGAAADAAKAHLAQGTPAGQGGGLMALLPVVAQLLANDGGQGGLAALVGRFERAGLGEVIASWIGRGENLPVSASQITKVFGKDQLAQIAGQLGVSQGQAGEQLAQWLPQIVDQLTPQGQAPAGGLGQAGELIGLLGGLLQKR